MKEGGNLFSSGPKLWFRSVGPASRSATMSLGKLFHLSGPLPKWCRGESMPKFFHVQFIKHCTICIDRDLSDLLKRL